MSSIPTPSELDRQKADHHQQQQDNDFDHPSDIPYDEWDAESIFNPPKPSIRNKSSSSKLFGSTLSFDDGKSSSTKDDGKKSFTAGLSSEHSQWHDSKPSSSAKHTREEYPIERVASNVDEISGSKKPTKRIKTEYADGHPPHVKFEGVQNVLSHKERSNDGAHQNEQDALSIKFSLSQDGAFFEQDGKDDSSFSDYLMERSPKGSLLGSRFSPRSEHFHDPVGAFPSPMRLQEEDHFDFHDAQIHSPSNSGFPLPKLHMRSPPVTPPRASGERTSNDDLAHAKLESPPSLKKSSPPRFPLEFMDRDPVPTLSPSKVDDAHISPYRIGHKDSSRYHPYRRNEGQDQSISPDRTIYHVPSKSPHRFSQRTPPRHAHKTPPSPYHPHPWHPSSTHSDHSTPSSSVPHHRQLGTPPGIVTSSRGRSQHHLSIPPIHATGSSGMKKDGTPRRSRHPTDLIVTPNPSELRQAISDESTSPMMLHSQPHSHHPPTIHHPPSSQSPHYPISTPSHQSLSGSRPGSGSSSSYPPSSYNSSWSDSLHLAPLPPYMAHQRGGQPPSWASPPPPPLPSPQRSSHPHSHAGSQSHHPPGWTPSPHGHPYYSPYYNQHQSPAMPPPVPEHTRSYPTPQFTTPKHPEVAISSSARSTTEPSNEQANWRHKHHLIYQFKSHFGHCNIPKDYGTGTEWESLHDWAMEQRHQYLRMTRGESSTMTPTRARMLSSLGFVWSFPHDYRPGGDSSNKPYSTWDKWMQLLSEYREEHGNVDVPLKYGPNPSLGTFVNRQRTEYRKMQAGKPCSMTEERVRDLDRLGFTWAIRESHTAWEDRFAELKEFKRLNGHCNVPKIYSKNPSLGYWVNEQRFQYRRLQKKKSSYMTQEKIDALNSLDFKWSLRETNGSWEGWMKELKAYKDEHGNVDVPLKYAANHALGAFVNRQRTEYRKKEQGLQTSLTEERIQDLNKLGFKWAIRVSRTPWEQRLEELKEFKAEYGHCNVPSTYPKNQPLAYWVFKQRGQYRIYMKGESLDDGETKQMCHMTPERIKALSAIGFEWNPPRRVAK